MGNEGIGSHSVFLQHTVGGNYRCLSDLIFGFSHIMHVLISFCGLFFFWKLQNWLLLNRYFAKKKFKWKKIPFTLPVEGVSVMLENTSGFVSLLKNDVRCSFSVSIHGIRDSEKNPQSLVYVPCKPSTLGEPES